MIQQVNQDKRENLSTLEWHSQFAKRIEAIEKSLDDGTEEQVKEVQDGITDLGQKMLTEMQETDGLRDGLDSIRDRMAKLRKKFQQDLGTGAEGEGEGEGAEAGGE